MIIGIDGNEANSKNRVGIGQFSFNVISQLEKQEKKHEFVIYLKEEPLSDFPKERSGWKYEVFGPGKLWTQIALPVKLFTQKTKLDVFFSPSHYAPRFSPVPTIISIMDLWHHRHPEQFNKKDLYQLTSWEKYSVEKASRIITISEFSKKEIIEVYGVPENKVTVAYPGYTKFQIPSRHRRDKFQNDSNVQKVKDKYGIKWDYFLYIGTLQPKKNIEGLIKAFHSLSSSYPHVALVIAGKKGWMFEKLFELVKELHLEERVIFTGFVSEEERPYLVTGAKAFVLPSFYEGFGIPVPEAMDLGVPVLASNAGSLPEVGGEAAIYCNPSKIETITEGMEKILNLNKGARNEIISLGRSQAKKFSWERCGEGVIKVLEGVKNVRESDKKN